jgi:hypothetical protein
MAAIPNRDALKFIASNYLIMAKTIVPDWVQFLSKSKDAFLSFYATVLR